ncbi:jasmonate-zim-domain protein 1 [Actinidia rufa]|uniref:Protein TIFY n=1 Tax=Actinidia rufa TaxID=165716 RepID=A0A7J0DP69_9ERIC|nr:jasmonate-zim-domain protein 1 [Actinidia rufa]
MESSSEFADSGRFSGQRAARVPEKSSNFSQTCNFVEPVLEGEGHIRRSRPRDYSRFGRKCILALVPQLLRKRSSTRLILVQTSQNQKLHKMTIFYAGQVIVFNDFPADKAEQIMFLAGKGSSPNTATFAATPVQKPIEPTNLIPTSSSTVVPNFVNNLIQEHAQQPAQPVVSDLPIARKASLARFLEKRKDRIVAKAPYPTSNSTAYPSKPAETKSWLGLAAQTPVPFEHQF